MISIQKIYIIIVNLKKNIKLRQQFRIQNKKIIMIIFFLCKIFKNLKVFFFILNFLYIQKYSYFKLFKNKIN